MLSRGSSDASARLRRAKSSSSVQRRHYATADKDSMNPEITHQQALTAASRAMQRAEERTSVGSGGSYDVSRHDDGAIRRRTAVDPPPRPQSIRFVDNEGLMGHISQRYSSPLPTPSVNIGVNGQSSPDTVTTPLPQISELGTIEDGVSSTPSSYRKLRRAKSMFSTRQRTVERNRQISNVSDDNSQHMGVLRRSISFMKGGGGQSLRRSKSQTAAVQLARDQFLQDLAQQSRLEQPVTGRRPKREQKPFRKTVRNPEPRNSEWTGMSSPLGVRRSGREGSFGSKARFLSLSIKKGFKRVFRRSSANDGKIQDPRQLHQSSDANNRFEAPMDLDSQGSTPKDYAQRHREYYGAAYGYSDAADSIFDRPPSLRTMSTDSLDKTNSRVTSWADSTTNQIPARQSSDRNRLSIIQEHGGQDPPRPVVTPSEMKGYAVFSKPLRVPDGSDDLRCSVDSQRVYSALRKKIDGNRSRQDTDDNSSIRFSRPAICPPERTSSIYSNRTCRTIRPVPSEVSIKSVKSLVRGRAPSVRSQRTVISSYQSEDANLTPQQIAHRNERIARQRSKKSVRDVNSTFFSPISSKKIRTPSPTKADINTKECQAGSEDDSGSVIMSQPSHPENRSVSPSIYSRTTDSNTPRRNKDDNLLRPVESNGEELGTATILASHRLPYHPSGDRADSRSAERPVKPSTDWRMWMNSQMNGLDYQDVGNAKYNSLGKPYTKHMREDTQINDEDEQTGSRTFLQQAGGLDNGSVFEGPSPKQAANREADSREPLVELKTVPQNNFSRPFRRSPNPAAPDLSPLFRKSSDMSLVNSKADICFDETRCRKSKESPRSSARVTSQHSSPWIPNKRSQSTLFDESPTRDRPGPRKTVSLRGHYGSTPTKYGHDMTGPDPTRFSSVRTRERSGRVTNENVRVAATESSNLADDDASYVTKPGDPLYSATSSKRMVDLFLSSRRRQMGASDESTSEPVFL